MTDQRYEVWMGEVERLLLHHHGMKVDEIGPFNYWRAWQAGKRPMEAMVEALNSTQLFDL